MERHIARLRDRFVCYRRNYPLGIWAPGLRLTNEMRALTEVYLPMAEISAAFLHILSRSLRYEPAKETLSLLECASWPDLLQRIRIDGLTPDPSRLLERLMNDEAYRIKFVFALFLPRRHGESFLRYPDQLAFLERRIAGLKNRIRLLDAACGTGEGAYDLAGLLQQMGIQPHSRRIHGCSIEPLEVFAAAHGYFPHDPDRELGFRDLAAGLLRTGCSEGMVFFRDDILRPPSRSEEPYDVILCNGLLGGPFIHAEEKLAKALAALAERLKPGGVLLAANRFHDGWKKKTPPDLLEGLLERCGLCPLPIADGLAGEKRR